VKPGLELTDPVSVSLIVPTLFRPAYLSRCLSALANQTVPPDEVLVGVRADDRESGAMVKQFARRLPVYCITAKGVGVVGSMNSCLEAARGRLVGFLDDDVELPAWWLETMSQHLQRHPNVVGAGGRDLLQDHAEMRATEPLTEDVGRFRWFGRISGNHHRGGGQPREVDLLRGSNCLYDGDFLRSVGFETGLRGEGAQVHWELALALQARRRHKRLFYDPGVKVLHHVGPRMDDDEIHRGHFSYRATVNLAYNETFVVLKHGSGLFRATALIWQVLVGTHGCPGIGWLIRSALRRKPLAFSKLGATIEGRSFSFLTIAKSIPEKKKSQQDRKECCSDSF
jgi:GT2 family glycosyltransferase